MAENVLKNELYLDTCTSHSPKTTLTVVLDVQVLHAVNHDGPVKQWVSDLQFQVGLHDRQRRQKRYHVFSTF